MKKSAIFALVLGIGLLVPAMGSFCKPADAEVVISAQVGFPVIAPAPGVVYVDHDDWRYRHWREEQLERQAAWDRHIAWERHRAWERRMAWERHERHEAYEHARWEQPPVERRDWDDD